jgi:glucokinase
MRILVGDIGGTKTILAEARSDGRSALARVERYPSAGFDSLEALVRGYLDRADGPWDAAAFAVAGPVDGDRSRITNLPWEIDARHLEQALRLPRVRLLNDLEAVAWGIPALRPEDLAVLHPGEADARGNACVVAAGTGLGQAGLYWDGARHHPFATEGGHADFAPIDAKEQDLLAFLRARYGHVSWERVVSGMGIGNLYAFLRSRNPPAAPGPDPDAAEGDLAATVAAGAADGSCPLCAEAMDLFARLYGREAGNAALKHLARGGVYLAGGIAPKNLALLRGPAFLSAFFDKGRMEPLMRRMPVKVILRPDTPLLGAARLLTDGGD